MKQFLLGVLVSAGLVGGGTYYAVSPAAESPAEPPPVVSHCPEGWASLSNSDPHIVVLACEKDGWTVYLTPEGTFAYAWDGVSPEFVTTPETVNWPW